jgi:hypothetical protein
MATSSVLGSSFLPNNFLSSQPTFTSLSKVAIITLKEIVLPSHTRAHILILESMRK